MVTSLGWPENAWVESKKYVHLCHTQYEWYYYVTFIIEHSYEKFIGYLNNIMNSKGYTFIKVLWQEDVPADVKLYFDFARVGVQIKDSISSVPFFIYLLTSQDKKFNAYIMRGSLGTNPVDVAEIITNAETGEILEKKCYV